MRKVFIYFTILAAGLIASTTAQAQVNMSRFITLTVAKDSVIKLNFKAAANDTPVKIKCGNLDTTFTVGTELKPKANRYTAGDNIMTIYGDLSELHCNKNEESLTAIDLSNNTELTVLSCYSNQISSLDVTKLTKLTNLYCYSNQISSLDLRNNTQLKSIYCAGNQFSSLDVSNNRLLEELGCGTNNITSINLTNNTELKELYCGSNKIEALNISKNTKLKEIYCGDNKLTSLDLSNNTELTDLSCYSNKLNALDVTKLTKLTKLYCYVNNISNIDISKNTELKNFYCYDNSFSTQALDDIYCSLPNRSGKDAGKIQPVHKSSSTNNDIVVATNKQNAEKRNWKVQYYSGNKDIATNGTYDCNGTTDIAEASAESTLRLYPNPVEDMLHITSDRPIRSIRIYNMYGTEVAVANDASSISVSHLPAGVYTVSVDGKVTKMIKK